MAGLSRGLALALISTLLVGCTSKTPTISNPFNSADRVVPPAMRTGPGGDAAYYPQAAPTYPPASGGYAPSAPSTFAPGQMTPSGYPAAPVQGGGAYPPAGGYAPSAPGLAPSIAPGSATPYYGAAAPIPRPSSGALASGDSISIPTDTGSLRFASPDQTALARRSSQPVSRSPQQSTQLASNPANQRRVATANGWIAGSAPIRSSVPAASPRIRMPGDTTYREPVSLAALDGGVSVRALEPVPGNARGGEPAPLRIAQPPLNTGWR